MEKILVKVPNISELPEVFVPLANLDQTMASSSSRSETLSPSTPTKKFKSSFLAATYASSNDSPSCSYLKYRIRTLSDEIQKKNKKIRGLQQIVRRKNKKIASLYEIICKLKNNNLLTEEDPNIQLFGNEKMEELVDIDNINDDDVANECIDNMLNNYLNGDFMDTSYTKQNVNTTQHDHNYFITAKGLMNEKYADVNKTIINDVSTDQLDKDVSLPTFDQPEKTSITITNAPKSVLKNSTNILTIGLPKKNKDYTIQWLLDSNTI
ncbi:uncharacterized protein LOC132939184 isoform X2 [Metopolophium dirhodum]|uniref:uncharacterized protein LOC132939184 isoform X2 n=1 Tax=Metopolophium dirhodum TaxID=44670 RepID=UPI00298FBB8E|nr:uncharacterized protein LOC132939184 isoform X2 [Metopolophium dirhodum]